VRSWARRRRRPREGRPEAVQWVRVRADHRPAHPGAGHAKANLRDTIEFWDLPITKGLQERIHEFEVLDRDIGLEPFLAELVAHPQLDVTLSEETDARPPSVAGGLSVALGHSFKIIDPKLVNPSSGHWERTFALFELLL
jgi:uncharacterized protein DUF1931